jgi:HEAT repeat protein
MLDLLLIWSAVAIGALALLMFTDIFVQRLRLQRHERTTESLHTQLLPHFYAYICGDMNVVEFCHKIHGPALPVAQDIILDFLRELEGEGRERLIEAAFDLKLIERTLRGLRSPDWTERELACMRLGRYGIGDTVQDLIHRLRDRNVQVRYTAARSLGLIGTPEAETALVDILDHPHLIDAPRILEIVQTMPSRGLGTLSRLLSSEDHPTEAKLLAIDLVGDLRVYPLSEVLVEILNSSSKEKVLRAIKALGKMSSPLAVSALLGMTHNRPWEIRAQALKALGLLQVEESIPLMVESLGDESFWVRRNAAEGLSTMGARGVQALFQASQAKDMFARDTAAYQIEQLNGKAHSYLEGATLAAPSPSLAGQFIAEGNPA